MPRMLTLHYLTDSRSQRIVWMLEELGVDYEVRVHRRLSNRLAPPSLRDVHPLGKAPVLCDDGRTFAESGNIVEYLAERYAPRMIPADEPARSDHRYWLHFAEGSLASALVMNFIFDTAEKRVPTILRPILCAVPRMIKRAYLDDTIASLLGHVDSHLSSREFFTGDELSCADIMMSFPLEGVAARSGREYPGIKSYVERVHVRPAYKAALQSAGVPYRLGEI